MGPAVGTWKILLNLKLLFQKKSDIEKVILISSVVTMEGNRGCSPPEKLLGHKKVHLFM